MLNSLPMSKLVPTIAKSFPTISKLFPTISKLFPTFKIKCYETKTLLDGTHSVASKQKVVCPRQTKK